MAASGRVSSDELCPTIELAVGKVRTHSLASGSLTASDGWIGLASKVMHGINSGRISPANRKARLNPNIFSR
ncbi:MAG: hypothetical protein KF870_03680 [Leadbetterella sp.]|nr:hypothetical protein [Leadbetterella sp.]